MKTSLSIFALLLFLCLIDSCTSYIEPVHHEKFASQFPFIVDGKTTRTEVLEKMDERTLKYKDKSVKILIYHVGFYSEKPTYELVLVFDDTGILKKHSWVKTQ